jgi:DNA-binding MarR family transcriptional regulator
MSSPTIGRGASQLYRLLREIQKVSLARGRDYVFPHQNSLADRLGVSIATVRRYLCELEAAGVIKRIRRQNGNRYYFLDPAETAPTAEAEPESVPLKMSGGTAQNERWDRSFCTMGPLKMSGGTAQNERCIDELNNEEYKEQQQQLSAPPNEPLAEETPAAADLFSDLKTRDATNALLGLDLSPPMAQEFAQADPGLALAVATAAAERFRDRRLRPVENKVGFVLAWLRQPLRCGFSRLPSGDWLPPTKTRASPAAVPIEERLRRDEQRRQAEADQARRDRQQLAEALDRWRAADPQTRAEILGLVRQRADPHAPTFLLDQACAAELSRRRQLTPTP